MTTRVINDVIADGSISASKIGFSFKPLDNISEGFDGLTKRFTLRVAGTPITIGSVYNLQISLGGFPILPAGKTDDYFNLPIISEFERGFKIVGTSDIEFSGPPSITMSFYGTHITLSTATITNQQHPFSAKALMLSD